MKNVDKVVENRIEKHLDLVEHNKTYYTEAEVLNTSEVLPATIDGEEKDTDFRYARENMYHIIERGRDAMDELLEIAKAEESPRAFEVVTQLINSLSATTKELLVLQKTLKEVESSKAPVKNENNLFVGSTKELQELLEMKKKK